jgi:coenzyme Q-binding protein COQ10
LPYAPDDLCRLVGDVRAYPRFIPWMRSLSVLSETENSGAKEIVAIAEVGWRAIKERFTSKVRLSRRSVDVALVDGPFKHLENSWRFESDDRGGAIVRFRIIYEFKNGLLQALVNANREIIADRIMKAFEQEAKRRFGAAEPAWRGEANPPSGA